MGFGRLRSPALGDSKERKMKILKWFLNLFVCQHDRQTWPLTLPEAREAGPMVVCLSCGKRLPYMKGGAVTGHL